MVLTPSQAPDAHAAHRKREQEKELERLQKIAREKAEAERRKAEEARKLRDIYDSRVRDAPAKLERAIDEEIARKFGAEGGIKASMPREFFNYTSNDALAQLIDKYKAAGWTVEYRFDSNSDPYLLLRL